MSQSNRNDRRVALDLEIDYSDLETFCQDYIRNISKGGVFIETKNPLALGTELKLKFRLPGSSRPIQTAGVVMWIIDPTKEESAGNSPGMGVRFGNLCTEDMDMIDNLVQDEMMEGV